MMYFSMMQLAIALACASTPESVATEPTAAEDEDEPAVTPVEGPVPQGRPEGALMAYGDPYAVVEAPTLEGVTLRLKLRYGGGCGEHAWSVAEAEEGGWLLVHDSGGDRCKAMLFRDVALDLAASGDVDLCGLKTLELSVALGPDGTSPGRFSLEVDEALSRCEGIAPEGDPQEHYTP